MAEAFGFLAVDKPGGMTSHDVVAAVRRGTGIRRIGHTGTLDPMATGVLIICVGAATRLSEYVMDSRKQYHAVVRLGSETDTYDAEGEITATRSADHIARTAVEVALARFQGEQDQVPPMYSAIKQGGKKLYELARKGQSVERPARRVWMQITLLAYNSPEVSLDVECSAGTYIRSLAHDLGAALGVGGHLAALRRVRSGCVDMPVTWEVLSAAMKEDTWQRYLLDERHVLGDMAAFNLTAEQATDILHGRSIPRSQAESARCRAYTPDGQFIAILESRETYWQPVKVFGEAKRT